MSKTMTADEYCKAIKRLSQRQALHILGVDAKTSRRYALDEVAVSEQTARLLRLTIRLWDEPDE